MMNTACAFTGHRPSKFPWRYDETDSRCVALKEELTGQITKLAEAGVTDFSAAWRKEPTPTVLRLFLTCAGKIPR